MRGSPNTWQAPTANHFEKLNEFLSQRLPDGFPVKLQMPVVPTVSATVEFAYEAVESGEEMWTSTPRGDASVKEKRVIDDDFFAVPSDFKRPPPKKKDAKKK